MIQKIKENQLYSISMKFLSGITKNPKQHMISKELKESVLEITVEERMKNLGLLLFSELPVKVNYILQL